MPALKTFDSLIVVTIVYNDNGIWKWKYPATSMQETGYERVIDAFNIISVDAFKKLDKATQQVWVDKVVQLIRRIDVYPIYYFNDLGIKQEIMKCLLYDVDDFDDALIENGNAGKVLLDFMFPNLHLAESGNNRHNCMYSRFYDDAKLAKCLARHMKNYPFTNMRTPFFMYGRFFWNTPVNFSPMRAKSIYEKFCTQNDTVYDFSAGFGGRMLGALSSRKNLTYIGCEPNVNTFHNLARLGTHIESVTNRRTSFVLHNKCSEELTLPADSIDFAFSCPPYYGVEIYSDEATQSINRYSDYSAWLDNYVTPTLTNAHKALKSTGKLGYVIAKGITYRGVCYRLGDDWLQRAIAAGFKLYKEYPIVTRSRKHKENAEALYIFTKQGGDIIETADCN